MPPVLHVPRAAVRPTPRARVPRTVLGAVSLLLALLGALTVGTSDFVA